MTHTRLPLAATEKGASPGVFTARRFAPVFGSSRSSLRARRQASHKPSLPVVSAACGYGMPSLPTDRSRRRSGERSAESTQRRREERRAARRPHVITKS